ncbi:pectinesterase-like [Ipomoea triloba]|uniref:pectinesterase-like n=1 Tax=Ipomoea triloba TaxID=35885 RepID=UPI00125DC85B|nr:pectinesterase-like [Ipomoea triloba]
MSTIKEFFAGAPLSGEPKRKKKIFLALFASVLLVAAVVGVVTGVKSTEKNSGDDVQPLSSEAHAIVKSSCSSTLYPVLCFSAIANGGGGAGKKLSSQKDVIELSLNITIAAVEKNSAAIKKLIKAGKNLTKREKTALQDCVEMVDETLDELHAAVEDLEQYPTKKSLIRHADDLKTLVSSAITNQETCLDGFSHDKADKHVREALVAGQEHVEKMCSNALAMITNMTDTDIDNQKNLSPTNNNNRKLKENDNNDGVDWPEWLSAGDRKLLQSSNVKPDVVVAADGSGNFRTVSEAVAKAPERSSRRYVIRIKAGVYRENVDVPSRKTNLMFIGDGRMNTIITANRNVVDGSTTFNSATVAVVGDGFLARDLTFQNSAGPAKHQAVALRVGSDQSAFYKCGVIAYQDSLYVHSNRQFFVKCYVAGTIDFIFGNSAAVLQDCDIHARRPGPKQKNMVTAQGRSDPNQNTGIVIQNCRIGATSDLKDHQKEFPTFLGRPWKEYSRTVVMQSSISDVIDPAGWHIWDGNFALNTLVYREYKNTGAGAGTSRRVNWKGFKVITNSAEAASYTPGAFIAGGNWLSGTGFPFSLGL